MSEKRRQLEQAATAAVQRTGLSNLSFRTLADEVGIKSSSVHYHFPEKSHLAAAVIAQYSESFAVLLEQIEVDFSAPPARLDAFVEIFVDVLADDKFCLCGMLAAEVDTLDVTNRAALTDYFSAIEDWLVRQLGSPSVRLRSVLTPKVLAQAILSGLEGAMLLDRISGTPERLLAQKALIAELIE